MRTAIVDDEKPARMRLLELLDGRTDIEVVGVARNGSEAVALLDSQRPDLLFLDINMPKVDGFGVLSKVPPARMPLTIFVTAYEQYALRAFESHAVDYLLKPFSDERFEGALAHARNNFLRRSTWRLNPSANTALEAASLPDRRPLERIVLRGGGRVIFVDVDELDWIEAADVYVNLHSGPATLLYRSSLGDLLQRLDPNSFMRVHRSAAVNVRRIRELRPRGHGDFTIVLRNGSELTLSRGYRSQLEDWLKQPI